MSGLRFTACLWTLLSLETGPRGVLTQASSIPNGDCETEADTASLLAARRSGGHICGGQNAPCTGGNDYLKTLAESFVFLLFQSINTPQDGVVDDAQMTKFLNLDGCLPCVEKLLGVSLQLGQIPASPVQLGQAPTTTDSPSTTNNPAEVAQIVQMLLPTGPATFDQFLANLQQLLQQLLQQAPYPSLLHEDMRKATASLIAYHGEGNVKSLVQRSSQLSSAGQSQVTKILDQSLGAKSCI